MSFSILVFERGGKKDIVERERERERKERVSDGMKERSFLPS